MVELDALDRARSYSIEIADNGADVIVEVCSGVHWLGYVPGHRRIIKITVLVVVHTASVRRKVQ